MSQPGRTARGGRAQRTDVSLGSSAVTGVSFVVLSQTGALPWCLQVSVGNVLVPTAPFPVLGGSCSCQSLGKSRAPLAQRYRHWGRLDLIWG